MTNGHALAAAPPSVDLDTLLAPLGAELAAMEERLAELVGAHIRPFFPEIDALVSGGKRLRGALAIAAARAATRDETRMARAVEMAAIIECLHFASLLHDDVIDHGEERRGRATLNRLYGAAGAILAGDLLVVRLMSRTFEQFDAETVRLLLDGAVAVIEGETRQTLAAVRGERVDIAAYLAFIEKKTAAFFRTALLTGARIGADRESSGLGEYGRHLGLVFQITDDVLDWETDGGRLGKDVLADIGRRKLTLPVLLFLEEDAARAEELIARADRGDAAPLALALRHGGHLARALALAEEHAARARAALAAEPLDPFIRALLDGILSFCLTRSH